MSILSDLDLAYRKPKRVNEPDYRLELIEMLAELASLEATLSDLGPMQITLARIKAIAREVARSQR